MQCITLIALFCVKLFDKFNHIRFGGLRIGGVSDFSHTLLTFLQPQPHIILTFIVIPRVSLAKIKAPKVDNYYAMVVGPQ